MQSSQPASKAVPIYAGQEPSEEARSAEEIFKALERTAVPHLEELCSRFATMALIQLALGVALTSLSHPVFQALAGNILEKVLLLLCALCSLAALLASLLGLYPRNYQRYAFNMTRASNELQRLIARKIRWARATSLLFLLGAGALVAFYSVLLLR